MISVIFFYLSILNAPFKIMRIRKGRLIYKLDRCDAHKRIFVTLQCNQFENKNNNFTIDFKFTKYSIGEFIYGRFRAKKIGMGLEKFLSLNHELTSLNLTYESDFNYSFKLLS